MKPFRNLSPICIMLAAAIFLASCSSSTLIQSSPPGAKVYMNGVYKGVTPYSHRDSKIVGSSTTITLEKEGCEPLNTVLTKDEQADAGAIVGGIFFLVPFLWTMKYDAVHTYELKPSMEKSKEGENYAQEKSRNYDKADKLRELKKLLDEGVITQGEFEIEKKKILEE